MTGQGWLGQAGWAGLDGWASWPLLLFAINTITAILAITTTAFTNAANITI